MSDDHVLADPFRRWTEVNDLIGDQSADPHAHLNAEDTRAEIFGRVVETPAATIEGMRVKCRVLLRMIGEADDGEDPAVDLIRSLAADLLRGGEG